MMTIEARKFTDWRRHISDSFVSAGSATSAETGIKGEFFGRLRSVALDGVSVADVQAGAHEVNRTPLLGGGASNFLKVGLLLSGRAQLQQDGQSVAMGPGDLGVCDLTKPYTLTFERNFRCVVLRLPVAAVGLQAGGTQGVPNLLLPLGGARGAITQSVLSQMGQNLDQFTGSFGWKVAQMSVELLRENFAAELGVRPIELDAADRFADVRTYMNAHLADTELTLDRVAAQTFMSRRALQDLFQAKGLTFSGWLRERRLERCQMDLMRSGTSEPVSRIGARWGFGNAAHFSRIFKERYGCSPREFRDAATRHPAQ